MKNTKHRENETMAKFNDFVSKLSKGIKKPDAVKDKDDDVEDKVPGPIVQPWMAKPLKFHVDSANAYKVQQAKEYE